MGAYQYMLLFEANLRQRAESYHYPEDTICILTGTEEELKNNFAETYDNLASCKHNRDMRSIMQYGKDLVASWLFEDYLIEQLQIAGLTIEHAGADRERRVLPRGSVQAASDFIVSYHERSRPLELMCDYTGWWHNNGTVELRDNKLSRMQNSNSLFLGVSTTDNKFILLDMKEQIEYTHIDHYRYYGGKPVDSVVLKPERMMTVDFNVIARNIVGLLKQ